MKENKNKALSIIMTLILTAALLACGNAETFSIDKEAATRGIEEGNYAKYIDDDAVALAAFAADSTDITSACTQLFVAINDQRLSKGIAKLAWSSSLENAAQVRAGEIQEEFSHIRPNGEKYWTVNSDVMYAENMAKNSNDAEQVVKAWYASDTHRENILNPEFEAVGIAICQTNDGRWYWACEFGKK